MIIGQKVCFPGGTGVLSALIAGTAHIQTPEGLLQKPATEIRALETPSAPETPPGVNPATGEETRDTSQIPTEPGDNLEVGVVEPAPDAPDAVFAVGGEGAQIAVDMGDVPASALAMAEQGPPPTVDLPKRVTAKWLRERTPKELQAALKNPDLYGPRRKRVEEELKGRGL